MQNPSGLEGCGMRNPGTLSLLDAEGTGKRLSSPKSLPDFQRVFPSEEACRAYLYAARFPNGFVCPQCGRMNRVEPCSTSG